MNYKGNQNIKLIEEEDYPEEIVKIENILDSYCNRGSITGNNNCKICYRTVKTENAKATVIILHGFTEFMQKFDELSWYLLNRGFNVVAYDQRGHGTSGRENNDLTVTHVNSFDDYIDDLSKIINEVAVPLSEGLPLFIFSHSMGGAVASLYLEQNSDKIEKAVLSSPMIMPITGNVPPDIVRMLTKINAKKDGWDGKFKYAKDTSFSTKILTDPDISLNRFKKTLETHMSDKIYQNTCGSNRWIYEAIGAGKRLAKKSETSRISTKVLILSAENDYVVKNSAEKKFSETLPDCRFVTIKHGRHSLFGCSAPILTEYYKNIFRFYEN